MDLFGISRADVFDLNKIKVLDGIAGSAKSSMVDSFMAANGVRYGRYTSSHKLRRDAVARYGGNVQTIAGGLFKTVDGAFFAESKSPEHLVVVIDEILQTDPRALKWCAENVGRVSIIICTDSRQMLTPHGGANMAECFKDFCKRPDVIYKELSYSFRPVDDKTRRAYDYCYTHALDDAPHTFAGWVKRHGAISGDELKEYDPSAAYICHSNSIEAALYTRWGLSSRYDIELIPKGNAAGRDGAEISRKIPILPQEAVGKTCARYYQAANLGSTTRYQGTEVQPGQKCYFICAPGARVSCREWYTALTRCKSIDSLQVVYMETYRPKELRTYDGKPVKDLEPMRLDGSMLVGGRPLAEYIEESGGRIPFSVYDELKKTIKDTADTHYSTDFFMVDGVGRAVGDPKGDVPGKKPLSTIGLFSREPDLEQKYMPDFWRAMEKIKDAKGHTVDTIAAPLLTCEDPKQSELYGYACDLYSAYSYILKYGSMPDGSRLYPAENRGPDWVRIYYVRSCPLLAPGCVASGVLVDFIRESGVTVDAVCIGSCRRVSRCVVGDYLYEHVHTTQEDKAEVKGLRYGYLSKPYLLPLDRMMITGEATAYSVDKCRLYELVMCCIKSELAVVAMKIRRAVYGDISMGRVVVDCVYFDSSEWSFDIGDAIKAAIPLFDFRLHDPMDKSRIFYQTYEALPTRAEKRKADARRRAKESRNRKKSERNK